MRISAKLAPCFSYDELVAFWQSSDELGFDAVWNYDHFYGLYNLEQANLGEDTFEAWTSLAAMATIVQRARVGCMVTGVTYRHPAVIANMAVTVDHISGGRLDVGLGAAWHEPEHRGYAIEFPAPSIRIAMLDEALTVIKLLWTEAKANFEGKFFRLEDALCNPKPVQRPHPPIIVGGRGRNRTMRVVAKHANEWNTLPSDPEEWAMLNRIFEEHCKAVGRDSTEVTRSIQLVLYPDRESQAEAQLAKLTEYQDLGCEHAVLAFYTPPSRRLLERVASKWCRRRMTDSGNRRVP